MDKNIISEPQLIISPSPAFRPPAQMQDTPLRLLKISATDHEALLRKIEMLKAKCAAQQISVVVESISVKQDDGVKAVLLLGPTAMLEASRARILQGMLRRRIHQCAYILCIKSVAVLQARARRTIVARKRKKRDVACIKLKADSKEQMIKKIQVLRDKAEARGASLQLESLKAIKGRGIFAILTIKTSHRDVIAAIRTLQAVVRRYLVHWKQEGPFTQVWNLETPWTSTLTTFSDSDSLSYCSDPNLTDYVSSVDFEEEGAEGGWFD